MVIEFIRILHRLWRISEENSRNYRLMIKFDVSKGIIKAEDNNPSPHLEFIFSISNFSIFDFKIKKITMHAFYNNMFGSELDLGAPTTTIEKMEVNHQTPNVNGAKIQLHPDFINSLKMLKKQAHNESIKISIDGEIDFTGDKEFNWDGSERSDFLPSEKTIFVLEIPVRDIRITQLI